MRFSALLALLLLLTSCSPGDLPNTRAQEKPLDKVIAQMEASGEYPILDRTDTLEGIDADRNGIRDDIDHIISESNLNLTQKNALLQKARANQRVMSVDLGKKRDVERVREEYKTSLACLSIVDFGEVAGGISAGIRLTGHFTNTKKRLKHYLKFNSTFDGTTFSADDYKNPCK